MRTASETRSTSPRRPGLVVSAALLSLLAAVVAYLGIAIAFSVAGSNGDAKAVGASAAYVLGAFGAPIAAGAYLARSRGWGPLRVVRFAAAVSLLIHAALLPVALAALAM